MPVIRRHLPGVRFVHILRDGPDVVASLWDARRRYPESWGWLGGLDDMVRLYNRYLRAARRVRGHADTFILLYSDLVERNTPALDRLAAFLGLPAGGHPEIAGQRRIGAQAPQRRAGHPPDPTLPGQGSDRTVAADAPRSRRRRVAGRPAPWPAHGG